MKEATPRQMADLPNLIFSGVRAALYAGAILMLTVTGACGDDIDTSELHAGECEVDADCPLQGQQCRESIQHNYHYCVPLDCTDDTDCNPDSVCTEGLGFDAPICIQFDTPVGGVPCSEEREGWLRCAFGTPDIVLCEDGVHRDVGACPDHKQECSPYSGRVAVRCEEPQGEEYVTIAVPGQDCYEDGIGACRPDREASLSCVDGTWEINQHCSTICRLLDDDEPGVECSGYASTCIGCAP